MLKIFFSHNSGQRVSCSAKQRARLFLQRDPELKSFALTEWLYFSHFIKFLWKDTCSILGCFGYNMFIFEKGKLLYRLPFFSARPLTVNVEEKTNYNNSVQGGTAVSRLSSSFCIHCTFLCVMELNVNEEITCKGQNRSFLCNKHTSQRYIKL